MVIVRNNLVVVIITPSRREAPYRLGPGRFYYRYIEGLMVCETLVNGRLSSWGKTAADACFALKLPAEVYRVTFGTCVPTVSLN